MPRFSSQLLVDPDEGQSIIGLSLWHDDDLVFSHDFANEDQRLNALVFKVRRNPQNLLAHLRRVYFCYQKRLPDQLYAALLDFVIVLQGKGQAISRRMIEGSRPVLGSRQASLLKKAINDDALRQGNRFSLLTNGLIGKSELVEYRRKDEAEHDVLTLANDFIEYSQIEQAMEVLETGIPLNPDRQELQKVLLELYKSTKNRTRFEAFYKALVTSCVPLVDEWRLTAIFFEGLAR